MILLPQLLAHGTDWFTPYIFIAPMMLLLVLDDIMMRG